MNYLLNMLRTLYPKSVIILKGLFNLRSKRLNINFKTLLILQLMVLIFHWQ